MVCFHSEDWQTEDPGRGGVSVCVWRLKKADVPVGRQASRKEFSPFHGMAHLWVLFRPSADSMRLVHMKEGQSALPSLSVQKLIPSPKHSHRNTQKIIGPHSWALRGPVKLKLKINHHRGHVKLGPREHAVCLVYLKHLGEQNQRQDEWGILFSISWDVSEQSCHAPHTSMPDRNVRAFRSWMTDSFYERSL